MSRPLKAPSIPWLTTALVTATLAALMSCNDTGSTPKAQGGKSTGEAKIDDDAVEAMLTKQAKCEKKGNVWLPPTDDLDVENAANGICGAKIAPLCCSLDGLKRKVIGSDAYEPRITALQDDGYQLYSCSADADGTIFLHFLKLDKGELAYTELSLTQSTAGDSDTKSDDDDGDAEDDPKACALDMDKVLHGEDGAKAPPSGEDDADSPFTKTINPLLVTYCDGGSCHGKGGTYSNYVGDEELVKSRAKSILGRITDDASPMPPKGSKELSSDDKKALVDYLTPLGK